MKLQIEHTKEDVGKGSKHWHQFPALEIRYQNDKSLALSLCILYNPPYFHFGYQPKAKVALKSAVRVR